MRSLNGLVVENEGIEVVDTLAFEIPRSSSRRLNG